MRRSVRVKMAMKVLFHGSPSPNLKVLKPKKVALEKQELVFASPDPIVAIAFARRWTSKELMFGRRNGTWEFAEIVPGALKRLEGPGHLYLILDPEHFRPQRKRGIQHEWISSKKSRVQKVLSIKNVRDALALVGIRMVPARKRRR
jgi:hypothetical protein